MNSASHDTTDQAPRAQATDSLPTGSQEIGASTEKKTFDAQAAADYFERRLRHETDCADVHDALANGNRPSSPMVLIDARSEQAYRERHIPGAISLPHPSITADTMRSFDPTTAFVTYCWGPHCNGATKAAAKIAALGFEVREMLGGLWGWGQEGYSFGPEGG